MRKLSKLSLDFISSLSVEIRKTLSHRGLGLLSILLMILGLSLTAGTALIGVHWVEEDLSIRKSQDRINSLAEIISMSQPVSNYGLRHYETDLGKLPDSLADLLVQPAGALACHMNFLTQKLEGWCGPYRASHINGENPFSDAWGRALVYDSGKREVRSWGGNGLDEKGSGDDLVTKF